MIESGSTEVRPPIRHHGRVIGVVLLLVTLARLLVDLSFAGHLTVRSLYVTLAAAALILGGLYLSWWRQGRLYR